MFGLKDDDAEKSFWMFSLLKVYYFLNCFVMKVTRFEQNNKLIDFLIH